MPNWCENDLCIKGSQVEVKDCLDNIIDDKGNFDFYFLIPMPPELENIQTGTCVIDGKKVSAWTVRKGKHGQEINEAVDERLLMEKYGHTSWYDWSIDNWGTKWTVNATSMNPFIKNQVKIHFDTAWAPPIPVIKKLIEKFPNLKFVHSYFECGMGFSGCIKGKDGKVISETYNDSYTGNRGG